jgi:hypothetical protein
VLVLASVLSFSPPNKFVANTLVVIIACSLRMSREKTILLATMLFFNNYMILKVISYEVLADVGRRFWLASLPALGRGARLGTALRLILVISFAGLERHGHEELNGQEFARRHAGGEQAAQLLDGELLRALLAPISVSSASTPQATNGRAPSARGPARKTHGQADVNKLIEGRKSWEERPGSIRGWPGSVGGEEDLVGHEVYLMDFTAEFLLLTRTWLSPLDTGAKKGGAGSAKHLFGSPF